MTIKVREPGEGISRRRVGEPTTLKESIVSENIRSEIRFLSVDRLIAFGKQARKKFDQQELVRLAYTIGEYGIRNPLTVKPKEGDSSLFEIVSGERRFRAAKMAGLDKVPCIILTEPHKANEIALIENLQRVDLHPIELGDAYKDLLGSKQFSSVEELAEKIGVSRSQVYEYLQYTEFPEEIKGLVLSNNISGRAFLRQLHECPTEATMLTLIEARINKSAASVVPLPATLKSNEQGEDRVKRRRKRTKMLVLRMNFENGELKTELKLKTLPKSNLPEIKEALQKLLQEIESYS